MTRPLITLTTDFGEGSPYIAQMKGAILSVNPKATLVDVTHSIRPQSIVHGAFVLADTWRYFPIGTIHVAVIDPGVGTDRKLVCVTCAGHHFILPDNGLLTAALQDNDASSIVWLSDSRFHRDNVCETFHGRDIMGPVAAHLSLGVAPRNFGRSTETLARINLPQPKVAGNQMTGEVILIDSFGNLVTNISRTHLASSCQGHPEVWLGGKRVGRLNTTYGDSESGDLVALFGSAQRLEIAIVDGDAATVGLSRIGDEVVVKW